jgi:RNA polymerase sigma-70 factor (ECF subfamily)
MGGNGLGRELDGERRSTRTVRSLVEQARNGDDEAFTTLAGLVGDRCLAIAYRILRDPSRAEDAVQVALVNAWRELPNLRDPDRFEAWLHRLLVNACYAEARRAKRWLVDVKVIDLERGPAGPDGTLTVDDRDQLERGFRRLPPEQRAVFVFHHYLGLSIPEVAERLDIPLGTAKSRLRYATTALRAALDADSRGGAAKERSA